MTDLKLTEDERQLLLAILQVEQRKLSTETRRTESFQMHHEMRERVRTVDRLIERLTAMSSTVAAVTGQIRA